MGRATASNSSSHFIDKSRAKAMVGKMHAFFHTGKLLHCVHTKTFLAIIFIANTVNSVTTKCLPLLLFICHCVLDYKPLKEGDYNYVFGPEEYTNISPNNLVGTKCYDNMWISDSMKKRHSAGEVPHKVIRRNLQDLHISDKKYKGKPGTVSDHCPIWACFSVYASF